MLLLYIGFHADKGFSGLGMGNEILGEAAEYYKAGDCFASELALFKALSLGPEKRKSRIAGYLERGAFFSWENATGRTLSVINRAQSSK